MLFLLFFRLFYRIFSLGAHQKIRKAKFNKRSVVMKKFIMLAVFLTTALTGAFGQVPLRDAVTVTPANPTTRDSLKFHLTLASRCCATKYRDNMVSVVNDTIISLSYTYDDSLCPFVNCFVGGSSTDFSSKPLAAGKYAIYNAGGLYCPPGSVCPLAVLAPELVGSVTVTNSTLIRTTTETHAAKAENHLAVAGAMVSAAISQSARVTLRAYDVRGALVTEIFNGWMQAGTRQFGLSAILPRNAAQEIMVLKLSINGTASACKTIMAK
jgi:hypothetical protein